MDPSGGPRLARLMLAGFDAMAAQVHDELARHGHPGVTAAHEFAMRAISDGAGDVSAVGRAVGVSRQAAAKTVAVLEASGYVARGPDPADARRRVLTITARGEQMFAIGAAAFDRLREQLLAEIGPRRLRTTELALAAAAALRLDPKTDPAAEPSGPTSGQGAPEESPRGRSSTRSSGRRS